MAATAYGAWWPLYDWLDDVWRAARLTVKESTETQRLLAFGAALITISLFWVSRTRRT